MKAIKINNSKEVKKSRVETARKPIKETEKGAPPRAKPKINGTKAPKQQIKKKTSKPKKKILTPEGEQLVTKVKTSLFGSLSKKNKTTEQPRRRSSPRVGVKPNEPRSKQETEQPSLTEQRNVAPIPSNIPSSKGKPRKFTYTRVVRHEPRTEPVKEVVVEEIKEEKVLMKRAKLDTVRDINDVGFFAKIGLVSYFNQKESGKLDERIVREEYLRNTKLLQTENSLKYFLIESAKRNLEHHQLPEITLQIDSRFQKELKECMESKLLESYEIRIEKQDEILSKMNVDPIIISMRLKRLN